LYNLKSKEKIMNYSESDKVLVKRNRAIFYEKFYEFLLDGVERNGSYSFVQIKKDLQDEDSIINDLYKSITNVGEYGYDMYWDLYDYSDRLRNNIDGALADSDLVVEKQGHRLFVVHENSVDSNY